MTEPLTRDEARSLTDQIRTGLTELLPLIAEAYERRAWLALEYATWDAYCDAELRGVRVPVGHRHEAVAGLRGAGMSTRAIGSALGVSHQTVANDLASGVKSLTPEEIVGTDGKRYAATRWSDDERDLLKRTQAGETVVVTLRGPHDNLTRWAEHANRYERIDRKTMWGNPFEMPEDGDRQTVIANYEPSLLSRLDGLRGKVLGCWCAPEPCHGDVLAAWADGRGEQC